MSTTNTQIPPEIHEAAAALRKLISRTETEMAPLKETIAAKEQVVRQWRLTLHTLLPDSEPDPNEFRW